MGHLKFKCLYVAIVVLMAPSMRITQYCGTCYTYHAPHGYATEETHQLWAFTFIFPSIKVKMPDAKGQE